MIDDEVQQLLKVAIREYYQAQYQVRATMHIVEDLKVSLMRRVISQAGNWGNILRIDIDGGYEDFLYDTPEVEGYGGWFQALLTVTRVNAKGKKLKTKARYSYEQVMKGRVRLASSDGGPGVAH